MKKILLIATALLVFSASTFSQGEITLVKDINPGANSSIPGGIFQFYQDLIFFADDGTNGKELWKSNGTAAGTVMIKDIAAGSANSNPSQFTEMGGKLYFTANDQVNGTELWVTNGTAAGTTMVKNINPNGSSNPQYLTFFNNRLFFLADDGTNGRELWSSDGTEAGTTMFYDITPGSGSTGILGMGVCNNKLFFSAGIYQGGTELWVTDGTTQGTMSFMELNRGTASSNPRSFTTFGNKLLFLATTSTNGDEPWITDGTVAGTTLLKDIIVGSGNSGLRDFHVFNNKAYFGAYYGSNASSALYVTDGTEAGTTVVDYLSNVPYVPSDFATYENAIYFKWYDANLQNQVFSSAGTPLTTFMITAPINTNALAYGTKFAVLNNKLFFCADYGNNKGQELYSYENPRVKLQGDGVSGPLCGAGPFVFIGVNANKYEFFVNNVSVQAMSTNNTYSATSIEHHDKIKVIGYNSANAVIGKDSITVNKPTVHNTVTVSGSTIYSNQSGATYLWSGCDGTTLTGTHTGYALNMTQTGSVQVQVTKDGCTVTSPCTLVIVESSGENPGVGIASLEANAFNVYPNPTSGAVTIDFANEAKSGVIRVTDLTGKEINAINFDSVSNVAVELTGEAGIYILTIQTENGTTVKRVSFK